MRRRRSGLAIRAVWLVFAIGRASSAEPMDVATCLARIEALLPPESSYPIAVEAAVYTPAPGGDNSAVAKHVDTVRNIWPMSFRRFDELDGQELLHTSDDVWVFDATRTRRDRVFRHQFGDVENRTHAVCWTDEARWEASRIAMGQTDHHPLRFTSVDDIVAMRQKRVLSSAEWRVDELGGYIEPVRFACRFLRETSLDVVIRDTNGVYRVECPMWSLFVEADFIKGVILRVGWSRVIGDQIAYEFLGHTAQDQFGFSHPMMIITRYPQTAWVHAVTEVRAAQIDPASSPFDAAKIGGRNTSASRMQPLTEVEAQSRRDAKPVDISPRRTEIWRSLFSSPRTLGAIILSLGIAGIIGGVLLRIRSAR